MFETMADAESVTSQTDEPVAIDPSLLNKPVHPSEEPTGSANDELLRHKLKKRPMTTKSSLTSSPLRSLN